MSVRFDHHWMVVLILEQGPLQDNTHSYSGTRQVLDLKHVIKRQRLRDINEKGVRIRPR